MIHSMTGYGQAQHHDGEVSYALELRSLNNRYFKASIKLPDHLTLFESVIEKHLRSRLARGTITYVLRVRNTSADAAQDINAAALKRYLDQLSSLPSPGPVQIDLAVILGLPGVCQPPEMDQAERDRQQKIVEKLTDDAVDRLIEMRRIEGRALRDDLVAQCERIRGQLGAVAGRAPGVLTEYNQRLLQRANELLGESTLPLQLEDVRREVAVYAERCDINEEIARMRSHLDQFERLCDRGEQAGRRLDFLAQEMLREVNTIGSKANDATIAHHVVDMKGSIDRVKEQVQNVE